MRFHLSNDSHGTATNIKVHLYMSGSWLMQPYIIVGVTQQNKVVGKNMV